MGLGMWIFWFVIIAIIVLLVRAAMGGVNTGDNRGVPSESALELLKKRYAKGEINRKEYERIRRDLEK